MEILIAWLFLAFVVALLASSKGHSGSVWFLVSVLLSPLIGGLIILVLPNLRRERLLKTALAGAGHQAPEEGPRKLRHSSFLGGKSSRVRSIATQMLLSSRMASMPAFLTGSRLKGQ